MPHPSENKFNIRVQTVPDANAEDALKEGLETLISMSDHIAATFADALTKGPVAPRQFSLIDTGSDASSSESNSASTRKSSGGGGSGSKKGSSAMIQEDEDAEKGSKSKKR